MERKAFFKVLVIYFLVSGLILASNLVSLGSIAGLAILPVLLSVTFLIPLWIWYRNHAGKMSLSKQIQDEPKHIVLFWVVALFLLALVVRIPAVLLFGMAYEKTPLIYLIILFIVVMMGNNLSVFGFRTDNFGRNLLLGTVYYVFFGLLPYILIGAAFYALKGQMLIEGFDLLPFLYTMPFMTFCVGISEEGLFRGFMQTRLCQVYNRRKAIFLQALLFGLWHFVWHVTPLNVYQMLVHVGSTFMAGVLFGYFYGITANLTPLVLAHGLVDSVPQGFIQNENALAALQGLPLLTQLLLQMIPYFISWAVTFALTKFLIKAIMERKDTKSTP